MSVRIQLGLFVFFFVFYKQTLKGVYPKPNLPKYASRNVLWHIAPLNAN